MKSISTLVIPFLIIGFFFLALPEKGYSGLNPLGCCISAVGCIGCESLEDCAIRNDECPAEGADFFNGEACLTNNGIDECKSLEGTELGCCVVTAGNCRESETIARCGSDQGIAWFLETECAEVPQCQQAVVSAVPTLSEWGLIAIAGILGIVGFMVIRRRKASA